MKLCDFEVGLDRPFFLISGPCVAESEQMCLDIAGQMAAVRKALDSAYVRMTVCFMEQELAAKMGDKPAAKADAPKDEKVVDAEFEEVDKDKK